MVSYALVHHPNFPETFLPVSEFITYLSDDTVLSVVGHLLTSLVDRVGGELKGELTKLLGTVVETVVVGLLVTVVVGLVTVVVGLLVAVVVGLRVTVVAGLLRVAVVVGLR
jgi:hypothetical protein